MQLSMENEWQSFVRFEIWWLCDGFFYSKSKTFINRINFNFLVLMGFFVNIYIYEFPTRCSHLHMYIHKSGLTAPQNENGFCLFGLRLIYGQWPLGIDKIPSHYNLSLIAFCKQSTCLFSCIKNGTPTSKWAFSSDLFLFI